MSGWNSGATLGRDRTGSRSTVRPEHGQGWSRASHMSFTSLHGASLRLHSTRRMPTFWKLRLSVGALKKEKVLNIAWPLRPSEASVTFRAHDRRIVLGAGVMLTKFAGGAQMNFVTRGAT